MNEFFRFKPLTGGEPVAWGVNNFPDGQQQFWIEERFHDRVESLTCCLCRPEHVELLRQILHTVDIGRLRITYLYGARSDKERAGDRLVCNVAALMLKTLRDDFGHVRTEIVGPHCYELAKTEAIWPMHPALLSNEPGYGAWLFPDESAVKRFEHLLPDGMESLSCEKERDQISGQIIRHRVPETSAKKLLVVDDLCDGGRTFLNIAEQMPDGELDLSVTHGVFSNSAVQKLLGRYASIYTTDSLPWNRDDDRLRVLDVWDP